MSTFDAAVQIHGAGISVPSEEALASGVDPHVEVGITAGLTLPFQNPTTGEAVVIPIGRLRFQFPKEYAVGFFKEALEAAEALPDPKPQSKILTATNMSQVEEAARRLGDITGR